VLLEYILPSSCRPGMPAQAVGVFQEFPPYLLARRWRHERQSSKSPKISYIFHSLPFEFLARLFQPAKTCSGSLVLIALNVILYEMKREVKINPNSNDSYRAIRVE